MAKAFDPYYKWLAIPPKDQPPNHYRLLAIEIYESDSDVIANAADQRMAHLKSYQTSEHAVESQRLLNEIAAARSCLLHEERKTAYDTELRDATRSADRPPRPAAATTTSNPKHPKVTVVSPDSPLPDVGPSSTTGDGAVRKPPSKRGKSNRDIKINVIGHIIAPIVGLTLGAIILYFVRTDSDDLVGKNNGGPDHGGQVDGGPPRTDGGASDAGPLPKKNGQQHQTDGSDGAADGAQQGDPPDQTDGTTDGTTDGNADGATDGAIDGGNVDGAVDSSLGSTDGAGTGSTDSGPGSSTDGSTPPPPEPTPEELLAAAQQRLEQAMGAADASAAVAAVARIAELSGDDPLGRQLATLTQLQESASTPEQFRRLASATLPLLDAAIESQRRDDADALAKLALLAARKTGDFPLISRATQGVLAVRKMPGGEPPPE